MRLPINVASTHVSSAFSGATTIIPITILHQMMETFQQQDFLSMFLNDTNIHLHIACNNISSLTHRTSVSFLVINLQIRRNGRPHEIRGSTATGIDRRGEVMSLPLVLYRLYLLQLEP